MPSSFLSCIYIFYILAAAYTLLFDLFRRRSSSFSSSSSTPSSISPVAPVKGIRPKVSLPMPKVAVSSMVAEQPFFVNATFDAFQQLSLDDSVVDVQDITDSFAKLSNKEWTPYSDKPLRKPSPEVDDLCATFAAFSTNDRPLEKQQQSIIDGLVSSFGNLSANDKPSEKLTTDMTEAIDAFGKLWDKELRERSETTLSKPSPEVDGLAACFSSLSYSEPRLRSCLKVKGQSKPKGKSVTFKTWENEDVDLCEFQYFEREESERTSFKAARGGRHQPHIDGEQNVWATNVEGVLCFTKALGVYHSPDNVRRSRRSRHRSS